MSEATPSAVDPAADQRLDELLGNLLRAGVLIAAAVVLAGGVLHLVQHGREEVPPYTQSRKQPEYLRSLTGIVTDAFTGDSRGIIQLGILLLIGTPIARVVFSVFAFFQQRDHLYVVVTIIVLVILLYSLLFSG
jgi:uncharacterized membrane protein